MGERRMFNVPMFPNIWVYKVPTARCVLLYFYTIIIIIVELFFQWLHDKWQDYQLMPALGELHDLGPKICFRVNMRSLC